MKIRFIFFTILVLSTLLFSCNKSTEKQPMKCLNGGTQNGYGGCDCPEGYWGNCEEELREIFIGEFTLTLEENVNDPNPLNNPYHITITKENDILKTKVVIDNQPLMGTFYGTATEYDGKPYLEFEGSPGKYGTIYFGDIPHVYLVNFHGIFYEYSGEMIKVY